MARDRTDYLNRPCITFYKSMRNVTHNAMGVKLQRNKELYLIVNESVIKAFENTYDNVHSITLSNHDVIDILAQAAEHDAKLLAVT